MVHSRSVKLLTNNPEKVNGLVDDGIAVNERIPIIPEHWTSKGEQELGNGEMDKYIYTKVSLMNHIIDAVPEYLLESSNDKRE